MAPQEPRIADDIYGVASSGSHESNDFIREIWGLKPLISAGGYMRDTATRAAERGNEFARHGQILYLKCMVSSLILQIMKLTEMTQSDFPYRLKANIPLIPTTRQSRSTLLEKAGYTDICSAG